MWRRLPFAEPIDSAAIVVDDKEHRWDRASVHDFSGTYGDYLLGKVGKVFPQLQGYIDHKP